jgi:Fe2+ transport system protein B
MNTPAQVFESLMLICFGCSWPAAIARTLKVRQVRGKSVLFLWLILAGYAAGIVAKFIKAQGGAPDWVTALYALNAAMVVTEIVLYYRFRGPPQGAAVTLEGEPPGTEVQKPGS